MIIILHFFCLRKILRKHQDFKFANKIKLIVRTLPQQAVNYVMVKFEI